MKDQVDIEQVMVVVVGVGGGNLSDTYERGFTQQLTASDQVTNSHMEIGVATTPVGNLGEWVCGQYVL